MVTLAANRAPVRGNILAEIGASVGVLATIAFLVVCRLLISDFF
jgi:hypothetical protein